MITPTDTQFHTWLDVVRELCLCGGARFPRVEIADQLADSFDGNISWNWTDADGGFGFELREPVAGFPEPGEHEVWANGGMQLHPLVRWYAATWDPGPTSIGRVPREAVPNADFDLVREMLTKHGLEQQLSIPHRLTRQTYRVFVIARGRDDFTEAELDLARRIQPLLALLERQTEVLGSTAVWAGHEAGLTSREVAVLGLLAEGLTATAIGHRMLISERTVHTHLRHIYAKLEVGDRMRAVLVAQQRGIVAGPRRPHAPMAVEARVGSRGSWMAPRPLLEPWHQGLQVARSALPG